MGQLVPQAGQAVLQVEAGQMVNQRRQLAVEVVQQQEEQQELMVVLLVEQLEEVAGLWVVEQAEWPVVLIAGLQAELLAEKRAEL